MPRTASRQTKEKRSYTLSPQSVQFLQALKSKRRAASVSAVLEDILQEARRNGWRNALESSVADYYSALPAHVEADDRAWADFAYQEFEAENH
jgi:hypothetical protein